jgi:hypothetical protein
MTEARNLDERPPDDWVKTLAESEADLASGLIVQGKALMDEVNQSMSRLEAGRGHLIALVNFNRRAAPICATCVVIPD